MEENIRVLPSGIIRGAASQPMFTGAGSSLGSFQPSLPTFSATIILQQFWPVGDLESQRAKYKYFPSAEMQGSPSILGELTGFAKFLGAVHPLPARSIYHISVLPTPPYLLDAK